MDSRTAAAVTAAADVFAGWRSPFLGGLLDVDATDGGRGAAAAANCICGGKPLLPPLLLLLLSRRSLLVT